jgi:hypothetical protein
MPAAIIPFQLPLAPALPTIEGNVDYRDLRDQFLTFDQLLRSSGLETQFVSTSLQDWLAQAKPGRRAPSAKAQRHFQEHCRRALRCNIARTFLRENFRGFAARVADSPLLQQFCGLSRLDKVRVPSKSTLQRYEQWSEEPKMRELIHQLLRQGREQPQQLQLEQPLDLESYFLDTTCLKAYIHYPVDWVLFRDATRTLMKAVRLIRDQGLKHRMEEPEVFLSRMNGLCLEMSRAYGQNDSQRRRKRTFRKIDKLAQIVRAHARRYRSILEEHWEQTEWTRKQAEQVLRRMDQVLEQLPAARRQARQRILKEEPVKNQDKILSLYEPEVRVIVRRKAGAEVEFGNTLLLGESPEGLIVDWELFAQSAPADARLLVRSLERTQVNLGVKLNLLGADRGFDSQSNQEQLRHQRVYNAVCPRNPRQLKKRKRSWKFKAAQRRRAQTEGRIGILKENFFGSPLRRKGFAHRNLAVTWGVLTHNLWVIATLIREQGEEAKEKAA